MLITVKQVVFLLCNYADFVILSTIDGNNQSDGPSNLILTIVKVMVFRDIVLCSSYIGTTQDSNLEL
jgi:hypothetical protein